MYFHLGHTPLTYEVPLIIGYDYAFGLYELAYVSRQALLNICRTRNSNLPSASRE